MENATQVQQNTILASMLAHDFIINWQPYCKNFIRFVNFIFTGLYIGWMTGSWTWIRSPIPSFRSGFAPMSRNRSGILMTDDGHHVRYEVQNLWPSSILFRKKFNEFDKLTMFVIEGQNFLFLLFDARVCFLLYVEDIVQQSVKGFSCIKIWLKISGCLESFLKKFIVY
jgi:hypothetical protein